MKREVGIRDKLRYYQGMLTGVKTGQVTDVPNAFLALSKYFPTKTMAMLRPPCKVDEFMQRLPPEHRG